MPKLERAQFNQLMERVRSGDQRAASELVHLYEPEIRREVRLRLTDASLRRTLDSTDVCQSIFGNFFLKIALGDLDFDRPEQLLRLFITMARNKVIDRHRRHKVRSPENQQSIIALDQVEPTSEQRSPSTIVAEQDLLETVSRLLTPDELRIAELRRSGYQWHEIADELNTSAESVRKRLSRARDRLQAQLGLDAGAN